MTVPINKLSSVEVVGLGALNIDNIHQVESIPGDGETAVDGERIERILSDGETVVKESGLFPGGSAANTIYALAKLGVKTSFIGVAGDDADGEIILQNFQEVGVDTSQIIVKAGAKTGSVLCLSDKLGKRSLYVVPGANSLSAMNDIDFDYLNRAEMLHISSFVDNAQFEILLELIGKLKSSVKVSFSPGALYAARGLKALSTILARTHIIFTNESEMRQLTSDDFNSGAKRCLDLGCHIVVVTLGQGASYKTRMATSYIRTAEREYVIEPHAKSIISVSGAIGAGDAFAAGFLYGQLKGNGLQECGHLGDIIAQFSISKVSAREGLPTRVELAQHYQQLYNQQL